MNDRDKQKRDDRLKYEMEHQDFLQISEERDEAIANKKTLHNIKAAIHH
jgi:hypothetical protein